MIYKIAKLLRIRFCGGCGRIIWWSKKTLRFIEDPEDCGYIAPACGNCIGFAEKHQYDY